MKKVHIDPSHVGLSEDCLLLRRMDFCEPVVMHTAECGPEQCPTCGWNKDVHTRRMAKLRGEEVRG